MGQSLSAFKEKITEQFHLVRGDAAELDFHQLGHIQQPRSRFYVNPKKLGLFWLADEDKNGRFSLNDLMAFVDTADNFREHLEESVDFNVSLIFMSYFRCYASLLLLRHLRAHGRDEVLVWLFKLVEAACPEPPRMVNNIRYWPGQVAASLYTLGGGDVRHEPPEIYREFQQKVVKAAVDNPPLQLGPGTPGDEMWIPQDVLHIFFNGLLDGFLNAAHNLEQLSGADLMMLVDLMADPSLHALHANLDPGVELSSSENVSYVKGSFNGSGVDITTPRPANEGVLE